mmetsp:Transcript_35660/g.40505  ORF Transcript_35660/g.40505 Transcript_35660/m.40505 type:complete len:346 (+) Transcript_35660:1222-2259(+)
MKVFFVIMSARFGGITHSLLEFFFISLFTVKFLKHSLFTFTRLSPCFFGIFLGFLNTVSDEDVIKDSTGANLPQIEADTAETGVFVKIRISNIFGIRNLRLHPGTLVVRVLDLLGLPLSLIFRVLHARGNPFSVFFIIPVVGFRSIRISDLFRDIIPSFRFFVFGIINEFLIDPIGGFFGIGVRDGFGSQKGPVIFQATLSDHFVVQQGLIGVVRLDNQSVQMGQLIKSRSGLLFTIQILSVVIENDMHLLVATTNIRTKHDVVLGFTGEGRLIEAGRSHLNVATSTVNLLLVLDGVLDDQVFTFVGELIKLGGQVVKFGIGRGLDTHVAIDVSVPFSMTMFEGA